mmetsp:Transcript_60804/g.101004  ORF Transcript_60804/g.101004 Transcript_60804/m.101004 type:complete len:390 (-) Transcript_60804:699-1868(-)
MAPLLLPTLVFISAGRDAICDLDTCAAQLRVSPKAAFKMPSVMSSQTTGDDWCSHYRCCCSPCAHKRDTVLGPSDAFETSTRYAALQFSMVGRRVSLPRYDISLHTRYQLNRTRPLDLTKVLRAITNATYPRKNVLLEKETHSDQLRYMMVVGLEHSGHHMWWAILQSPQLNATLDSTLNVSSICWSAWFSAEYWPACQGTTRWLNLLADALRTDKALKMSRNASLPPSQATLVVLDQPSYPYGRAALNPDAHGLAKAAETAQVDIRFVVLTRPAHEIIYRWTRDYLGRLSRSCSLLLGQLQRLHPTFYMCFPYNTGDRLNRAKVTAFLSRDIVPAMSSIWKPTNRSEYSIGMQRLADLDVAAAFGVLNACTLDVEHHCRLNKRMAVDD